MPRGVYKHYSYQGFQKGYKLSEEARKKISLAHKNRIPWNKGTKGIMKVNSGSFKKGVRFSKEFREKMSLARIGKKLSEETRKRMSLSQKGEKSYRWINNRELAKRNLRNDGEYLQWVSKVKNRDKWQCKINNQDCSGYLIVHHILLWSEYPELRYEINNGITLCQSHHPKRRMDEIKLIPVFQEMVLAKAN